MNALESWRARRVKYVFVRTVMSSHRLPQWVALVVLMRRLHRDRVILPALAVPDLRPRERLRRLRSALLATHIKPHALFDPEWYHWLNPDTEKVPPLLHYVLYGHRERRSTHPLVDPDWLTRSRPDIAAVLGETVRLEALNPFLEGPISSNGSLDDIESTEFFDASWHSLEHPDVLRDWASVPRAVDRDIARGPLSFWTHRGRAMGLPPSPLPVRIEKNWSKSDASIRALLAESGGQRLFRLERIPTFEDLTFSDATAVAEDRLILDEDRGLAYHSEALEWLSDPALGRKSRNFSLQPPNVLLATPRDAIVLDKPAVHFLHEYSFNYFHAMTEVAARLVRYMGESRNHRVTALLDESVPKPVSDLIRLLLPAHWNALLIPRGFTVTAPHITYPAETARVTDRYRGRQEADEICMDVASLRAFMSRIDSLAQSANSGEQVLGDRLFIPRVSHSRRLLNSDEIELQLASRGFQTYVPTGSVLDQRRVFKGAQLVVAPTGAALTNILFMQPKSLVVVLSSGHESVATQCWDALAEASGVHVHHVRGLAFMPKNVFRELEWHHDYWVDPRHVLQAVGQ